LAQAGITDLATLASSAGYTFQSQASTGPGGRDNPSLTFRGLQSFYTSPAQNSGALFVDGIFVSGGQASVTTVDIDHVEVLKGPQSTFFGRNTFGGAINFITAPPSNTWQETRFMDRSISIS
jgi:iron complex outermembrane receptor protein